MQTASTHGYSSGELALSANLGLGLGGMRMDKEEKMLMIWCNFSMVIDICITYCKTNIDTLITYIYAPQKPESSSLLWHSVIVQNSRICHIGKY